MAERTWDKNNAHFSCATLLPGFAFNSELAHSPLSFLSHIMHVLAGARASRRARNRTQPSTSVLLPRHVAADDDHDDGCMSGSQVGSHRALSSSYYISPTSLIRKTNKTPPQQNLEDILYNP
ncbi:hypothetical protein E2C01_012828 [Portunus trituberculatus]|uniref:Uncharacterized protein n=1 Tax=Portunus trituberculatus TaxID=210409 RepID=A0A5B7DF20_PORTR|nr:hypothetical protein [Portunus trituberculatus]